MVAKTENQRIVLESEPRQPKGRMANLRLRGEGKLPAIIYGLKGESTPVALDAAATEKAIHSGAHLLDLKLDGQIEHVLIQEVQYDHLQKYMQHVDFLRIDPAKPVRVRLAIEFRGVAKGTKEGGVLDVQHSEIDVETLPLEIPDSLRVNIDHLELYGSVHAKEIALPAGMKLMSPPEQIICQVKPVKEVAAATDAAPGPSEPEVIGKKPDEDAVGTAVAAPAAGKKAEAQK